MRERVGRKAKEATKKWDEEHQATQQHSASTTVHSTRAHEERTHHSPTKCARCSIDNDALGDKRRLPPRPPSLQWRLFECKQNVPSVRACRTGRACGDGHQTRGGAKRARWAGNLGGLGTRPQRSPSHAIVSLTTHLTVGASHGRGAAHSRVPAGRTCRHARTDIRLTLVDIERAGRTKDHAAVSGRDGKVDHLSEWAVVAGWANQTRRKSCAQRGRIGARHKTTSSATRTRRLPSN